LSNAERSFGESLENSSVIRADPIVGVHGISVAQLGGGFKDR
jgi:hypothetical protein